MKTATEIPYTPSGERGDWKLYKLDPPMKYERWDDDTNDGYIEKETEHIIVSAAIVFGEPETYIFPSDENGSVTSWGEMPGSFKGALDHEEALRNAGYTVA